MSKPTVNLFFDKRTAKDSTGMVKALNIR